MAVNNGGIKVSSDFQVNVALPIDSKLKVATIAERDAINFKYVGLISWVDATALHYKWIGPNAADWQVLGADQAASAVAAHEAASDPHPQYMTQTESDARYSLLGHTHTSAQITDFTEAAQDAVGAAVTAGTSDGAALTYDDANNRINISNTDKGSTAVSAHEAAADPHPQYLTQAEGDSLYQPLGAGGDSVDQVLIPGQTIASYKAITTDADGYAIYADSATLVHLGRLVGISLDGTTKVRKVGLVTNPAWNWTPGAVLFLGLNGEITTDGNTGVFAQQIAYAQTPTTVDIKIGMPIRRA